MRRKKNIVELTRYGAEEYLGKEKLGLRLLVDNVRSLQNVGSLFRTSDAFMVEEVILGGITGCPPHPELSKSALGAEESVRWRHVDSAEEEARRLQGEGWKIVCLEQAHDSVDLSDYAPQAEERIVLVVGNEVEGINQKIVDLSDTVVEIRQSGVKHSLNVAVSGGIALWKISEAMQRKG